MPKTMITDFIGIAIVGAALSGIIQWVKIKVGAEGFEVKFATILLSMLVGTLYVLARDTSLWPTILGLLSAASTVYAFLLK